MIVRGIPIALVALALLVTGCGLPGSGDDSSNVPKWASTDEAKIRPGAQTNTQGGGQCTSNFVFYKGDDVYLGQAAHCASTGGPSGTNGCKTGSRPLGTRVKIEGATRPGTLAYSSWPAMRKANESDKETCAYNDLALVRLDPADRATVNPSIPSFGGPTGIGGTAADQRVYSYGNSELRLGIALFKPKVGTTVGSSPGGWSHVVYTLTPGIPGDSGSGVLNSKGQALGVISTLRFLGKPLSNGVGDVGKELDYARAHGFKGLELARGTEKFQSSGFLRLG